MTVSQTVGDIKRFKRTPWRFQQTVEIPAGEKLSQFVSTIISAQSNLKAVTVIIVEIVFNVVRMESLLGVAGGNRLSRETSITTDRTEEAEQLLTAAFFDGNEFIVIPTPKPFVLYADHDGWMTCFANTKSNLNKVITPLEFQRFKLVANWQREL